MRLNVKLADKILSSVGEGNRFFSSDGKIFSNLKDLRDGLRDMSDEVFFNHVKEGANDFSNWIRDCIGDVRLADSLIGLDRKSAFKKLRSRISYIEKYLRGKE